MAGLHSQSFIMRSCRNSWFCNSLISSRIYFISWFFNCVASQGARNFDSELAWLRSSFKFWPYVKYKLNQLFYNKYLRYTLHTFQLLYSIYFSKYLTVLLKLHCLFYPVTDNKLKFQLKPNLVLYTPTNA